MNHPPGAWIAGRYGVTGRPLLGGMGIVYVCFDHEEQRPMALKTFKPEFLPDRAARDRFLREGTTWVNLGRHPHIVRCHRVVQPEGALEIYLVLDLVAKEEGLRDASLRSWLMPGAPLSVRQSLLFALQIARGMAHATTTISGFVHRDLKPENVLVGVDRLSNADVNRLQVTDFGLAAVLQDAGQRVAGLAMTNGCSAIRDPLGRTQLTRGVVGTPLYMAPEQWRGEQVTAQTDIYAMGCILYEMLAGQQAAPGDGLAELERAHCEGRLRPLPRELPKSVADLVARCLSVEPGRRYGGWEDVEEALGAVYTEVMGCAAPGPEPVEALNRAERVAAGWSYSEIGNSYLDIGKADVALGYYQCAQELGMAEGERQLEAAGLNHLGLACKNVGKVRQAIQLHEQALAIFREVGDRRNEETALANLGDAYLELGDSQRAIGLFEQALAIARTIGKRHGEGITLNKLGSAHLHLGDAQRAIGLFEQALAIDRQIGNRCGEGGVLGNMGLACLDLGDVRRTIGYCEQALVIAREVGDRRAQGNNLNCLGEAYRNLGDMRQAIRCYEQALTIAREINDRRGEGVALNNLGIAYKNLGDLQRAVAYYQQRLELARETGDRYGEGKTLGNLGNAYAILGELRRAITFYEQRLELAREIGDRRGEAAALGNLGSAYAGLGEVQWAIGHYEQALAVWRGIGGAHGVASNSFNMALLYAQQGEWGRALPLAQQSAGIWEQIGNPSARRAQDLVVHIRAVLS
jgi:tetratricopeptide (TPR) repeat protein